MCYSTHDCTFIQQSDYRYNRKPHQTLPVNWNNPPHNFSTSVLSCLSIIQCCSIIRWTNQVHEHDWTFVSSCQISDIFSPFLVTLSVIWYYIVLQSAITATVRLQALSDLYRDSFTHTHLQIHNQWKYKLIMIYLWKNCLYISYTSLKPYTVVYTNITPNRIAYPTTGESWNLAIIGVCVCGQSVF